MKLAKVFKENKQFTLFSILALVVVGVAVFAQIGRASCRERV